MRENSKLLVCTLKKKLGPDRIHIEVLKELTSIFSRLLSIIFERSERSEEVLYSSQKTKLIPSFQKCKKDDMRNHRQVSFT